MYQWSGFTHENEWKNIFEDSSSANCKFRGVWLLFPLGLIFIKIDNVTICFPSILLPYFHSVRIGNGFITKNKSIIFEHRFINVTSVQTVDRAAAYTALLV